MRGFLNNLPDLEKELIELLKQIPPGKVATCGQLADALGNKIAARWVGYFLAHHDHTENCFCHRVVRADGSLGEYIAGGTAVKRRLLEKEGVPFSGDKVDLEQAGATSLKSSKPLQWLRRVQEQLETQVRLVSRSELPELVAGVDVSYIDEKTAVAAYALIDTASGELVWHTTARCKVNFPYITTYLAFRELPALLVVLEKAAEAGHQAEVIMVDGSGRLHHRHVGVASHLGVVAQQPTVGVTKTLLCGQVDLHAMPPLASRPVLLEDEVVGMAIRPTAGSRRPIFVSPGHLTDVDFAERLTKALLKGRRLPEPLYWADRLSRRHAQQIKKAKRKGEAGN